jgi:hypothetical protein
VGLIQLDITTRDISCRTIAGNISAIDNTGTLNNGKNSGTNNIVNIGSGLKNTNLTLDGENIYIRSR